MTNGNTLVQGTILTINHLLFSMPIINILAVIIKHIFCMTIFYISNPTQYLNLTTTLLTINKQQIQQKTKKSNKNLNKFTEAKDR